MKQLTIIASIPPNTDSAILRKVWMVKSYLKEEVGVNVSIAVMDGKGKPKIIAMGEVIDMTEDLGTIVHKITASMAYDLGDPNFLDKVAIGGKTAD